MGIPLLLKRSDRTESTEADALRFLNAAVPHLPIPKLIDSFHLDGVAYTLMTKLPGCDLARIDEEQEPTVEEMKVIAEDLLVIIEALWRIPQPKELNGQVMVSASEGGLPHPAVFRERLGGPYASTHELYQSVSLNMADLPPDYFKAIFADPVVWTHTDLTMRNVMIHKGRVSGVIDWEDAGWLPRHWLLHNLRLPRPGCQGIWARYWLFEHRFPPEVEEPYNDSAAEGVLSCYLR